MVTVKELQALLRARGLPVSGRKAQLIERLSTAGVPVPVALPVARRPDRDSGGAGRPLTSRAPARAGDVIAADETPPKLPLSDRSLRIASWNVAGLRGLLKRDAGVATLRHLVDCEEVDVLMLQETKLQEQHVLGVQDALLEVLGSTSGSWRASWACSTARKGYSGVATLWSDRRLGAMAESAACTPLVVDPGSEAELEGRTLTLELPLDVQHSTIPLSVINVYTPNAGAELRRLEYRSGADGWDDRFRESVARLLPSSHVCVAGDLNVAAEDIDFLNPHEPRMAKQAGTTPEERASFRLYAEAPLGLTDAFRHVHPHAQGQYTYWSQRARNRPRNRGLRIDYFLLSQGLLAAGGAGSPLRDVQLLQGLHGSDHCPIIMHLDPALLGETA
jgi:AP endonuclease-1